MPMAARTRLSKTARQALPARKEGDEILMRRLSPFIAATTTVIVIAGCGGSSNKPSSSAYAPATTTATLRTARASLSHTASAAAKASAGTVKVSSASAGPLGHVLVNARGHTLYTFSLDSASKVTCVSSCALVWPPVKLVAGEKPVASGEVKQSLLGTDPDPEGGSVVTYNGWPLYAYVADSGPGSASGQALNLNGGYWYAIAPSGTILHQRP